MRVMWAIGKYWRTCYWPALPSVYVPFSTTYSPASLIALSNTEAGVLGGRGVTYFPPA